jgi:hypothetical protein
MYAQASPGKTPVWLLTIPLSESSLRVAAMGHQEGLTATGLVPMAAHLRATAASASATGITRTLGSPAVLVMTEMTIPSFGRTAKTDE